MAIFSSLLIFDGAKYRLIAFSMFDLNEKKITSQHINHYIIAIDIFKDYPVFGTGHKTFRLECASREHLIKMTLQKIKDVLRIRIIVTK